MNPLERARAAYNAAVERRDAALEAAETAGDEATDDDREALLDAVDEAQGEVDRCKGNVDRLERIYAARAATPAVTVDDDGTEPARVEPVARGQSREEPTYRIDKVRETSFLRDLVLVRSGDTKAAERLQRNRRERIDALPPDSEWRDMGDAAAAGAEFVPAQYMAGLWVGEAVGARAFVDKLPKLDLPTVGTQIDVPHFASGLSVAGRASGGNVSDTDGVTATISHYVNELSGQVDIDRIAVMRSNPPIDVIVGRQLVKKYNATCETYALAGSGTPPQHDGIRNVTGKNAVSYTAATPTQAGLLPKLYDAAQQVWDGRKGESIPDLIVMHPRRSAWLASGLSSSVPLFQQGSFLNAVGGQDGGFVRGPLGLTEVVSPHVATNYSVGGATNEDEIYIVASEDLIWMEGPMMARVFEDVGSGTGTIRFQIFAFSAFLSNLYPEAIAVVAGTGLVAPAF